MRRTLEKLLDSAIAVGTAACVGYLVGVPAVAGVGSAVLGGVVGALALLTSPSIICFSMLVGAVTFTGFFTPDCPQQTWARR